MKKIKNKYRIKQILIDSFSKLLCSFGIIKSPALQHYEGMNNLIKTIGFPIPKSYEKND